jgi:hypothetical protein
MPVSLEAVITAFSGRYDIERELGRGGFATVFRARDLRHDRQVAIKVLDPDLAQGAAAQRFVREIALTANLSHPNILPLYDSGEAMGLHYFVMPVAAESLRSRLDREGSLPIDEAVDICCAILDGLAYAHDQNVLHRDLKPDNILLDRGRVMIADFGIARALMTSDETVAITKTGFAVGTAGYMSPEQAAGGRLDVRSDIYGVGCILYEMIGGEPPITGPTPQAILGRLLAGDIRSLRPIRSAVSAELDATVRRALATSAVDRFPTAAAFRVELQSHRSGAPAAPPNVVVSTAAPPPRRRRTLAILLPLLLLVGGGIAFARYRAAAIRDAGMRGIAVLPFRVLGGESDLSESLADLLATTLEGTPGMRVVDPWSLWRPLRSDAGAITSPDPDRANTLSRRFNARYFVLGSVSEASRHLTLTLRMYRVGDITPIGNGISIVASADSVNTLVQRAAVALITKISDGAGGEPMNQQVTANPDALKAYLGARVAMRRGLLDQADADITRALALDSTFAVAAIDAIVIRSWAQFAKGRPYSGLRQLTTMAAAHSAGLSERQRLRIEMYAASVEDQGARAAEAAERLVQLDSADIDSWVMLSFVHLTLGWQYGAGPNEAIAANERAIALDSTHVPALAQRAYLSAWRNDANDIKRVLRLLHEADTSASMIRGYELALAANSATDAQYAAMLDTIADQPVERWLAVLRSLRAYRPERAEQLVDRLLARPAVGLSRRTATGARVQLLVAEGRAAEIGKQVREGAFSEFPGFENVAAAALLASSFTGVEDSTVTAMAVSKVEARVRPDSALEHFNSRPVWWFGWLQAAHHAMRGDQAKAKEWQRIFMQFPAGGSPATYRESLVEDIASRLAARAGDMASARAHATNAYRLWGIHDSNEPEFNPAPAMRFNLARLLQTANKPDSAALLYRSLTAPGTWMGALGTRAELELGHISEEGGAREEAAYHYATALRMWERGGPGVARWRSEASTGLDRTGGEPSAVRFLSTVKR